MRYELRLTAFDMLDQVHVSAVLYEQPDDPARPTERVWARTATTRNRGRETATEWIREVLDTTLSALDDGTATDATAAARSGGSS